MDSRRTILITGCSDGSLGSALALAFHKAGWRVFASARNMSKLTQSAAADIELVLLDVTSEKSIASAVSQIEELTGGLLDVLLNNAGAGYSMPMLDVDMSKARELFELNVFSLVGMTRAFFPLLTKSTRGGVIVNNTTAMFLTAGVLPFQGTYAASKAAAANLTEVLRLELEPFGIKVINLITGAVRSTFFDNAPTAHLPSTSIYNISKEVIEKYMAGEDNSNGVDPDKWAAQVVKDLEKLNPPHWLWRGRYAPLVRVASLFPVGFLDRVTKRMAGIDILERKIQEQDGRVRPSSCNMAP